MALPQNLRPAPNYTLPTLGTGATITATAVNGYQNAMAQLAGRGGYCQTAIMQRVNGLPIPVIGVRGGPYKWIHGFRSVDWEIPIGSGINAIQFYIRHRLDQTINVAQDNTDGGGSIRLDLVLNGFAKNIYQSTYRDAIGLPLNEVETMGIVQLDDLFKLPISQPAYMALVMTFDTVGNADFYGEFQRVGTYMSPTYWMGVDMFGFAAFRDCEDC